MTAWDVKALSADSPANSKHGVRGRVWFGSIAVGLVVRKGGVVPGITTRNEGRKWNWGSEGTGAERNPIPGVDRWEESSEDLFERVCLGDLVVDVVLNCVVFSVNSVALGISFDVEVATG